MAFPIYRNFESFQHHMYRLNKYSNNSIGYLNTKGSLSFKKDRRVIGWLKWYVSIFPGIHIAQTNPLRVAKSVEQFACRHSHFLSDVNQETITNILEKLKKGASSKNKESINRMIDHVNLLKTHRSLSTFPSEMLDQIFSHLEYQWDAPSRANQVWHEIILQQKIREQKSLVKGFYNFLILNLKDENARLKIKECYESFLFTEISTFTQLKTVLVSERLRIFYILRNHAFHELERLVSLSSSVKKPRFFSDLLIFGPIPKSTLDILKNDLASTHIINSRWLLNISAYDRVLINSLLIIRSFIQNGFFDQIAPLVFQTFQDKNRSHYLLFIASLLITHHEFNFVFSLVGFMDDQNKKDDILQEACKALMKKNLLQEALDAADKMSNPTKGLTVIVIEHAKAKRIDLALQVLAKIKGREKESLKKRIIKILLKNHDYVNAGKMLMTLLNWQKKLEILNGEVMTLLENNLIEEAFRFTEDIGYGYYHKETLQKLSQKLIEKGLFARALEFAKRFRDEDRNRFLHLFIENLVKGKQELRQLQKMTSTQTHLN